MGSGPKLRVHCNAMVEIYTNLSRGDNYVINVREFDERLIVSTHQFVRTNQI